MTLHRISRTSRVALALVVVGLPTAALVGCGGGSGSSSSSASAKATGKATIKITWPTGTAKLIPAASSSITVAFYSGTTAVKSQTVSKPTSGTSTLSFTGLPAGSLTLVSTAYPNTDGSGTAQATASQAVTITGGSTATLSITMASTVASLSVSPTSVSVTAGSTTPVTATALDSSGATVLVGTSTLTYASSNTAVATVNATTGVVTGVSAGSATITATESESGKTATSAVTVTSTSSGTDIVSLTNTYLGTLSSAQLTATEVAGTSTYAAKWINLPATPNSDGTQSQRNGVSYSSLTTTTQKTAWANLVNALLASGTALNQFNLIRGSDNTLRNTYGATGYSGDYQYIGVVGTPSTTAGWMLQLGGHHNAHNYYFVGNSLQTTTPYFLGTEPTSYTSGGTTVYPMGTQFNASSAFLKSLTTTQLSAMKLTSSFSDVYLGPGKDARSNFPTGTSGRGALVSSLSLTDAQKANLKAVIDAWTLGRSTDSLGSYSTLYETDTNLSNTYVAYAGNSSAPTTVFTAQGDYLRIDGPNVWIEFVCQNGIVIQNQIHYHSIWRDRVTDYDAAYGF